MQTPEGVVPETGSTTWPVSISDPPKNLPVPPFDRDGFDKMSLYSHSVIASGAPTMRRFALAVAVCLTASLFAGVGPAQDKIIGAIWEIRVKLPGNDKYESKGFFRCTTDGKVYRDGELVGTHKNTGFEDVEITLTAAGPKVNGVTKAKKVTKNGNGWEGVHTTNDNVKVPVRLLLKKD
jgi:hypothetical protein